MAISRFCLCLIITCCTGSCAQAWWDDWEVETFTRYRIDNFDNNNNGYVYSSNDAAQVDRAESVVLADQIAEQAMLRELDAPFLIDYAPFAVNPLLANTSFQLLGDVFLDRDSGALTPFFSYNAPPFEFLHVNAVNKLQIPGHKPTPLPQYIFWNVAVWEDNLGLYRVDFGPDRTRSYTQSRGMSLEKGIRIAPYIESEILETVESAWEISFGVSYRNNVNDYFMWGDFQGSYSDQYSRLESDTDLWSESVGPHLSLVWAGRYKDWEWQLGGKAHYAYQFSQAQNQSRAVTPFLLDESSRLEYSGSDRFSSQQNAWLGDVRVQATRRLAENLAVSLGYVNYFLGEIHSAAAATQIENNGASIHDVRGTDVSVGMAYLQFALQW